MVNLPEQVMALAVESSFRFQCHPGVPCFTACCRALELALSPYDVLRLKRALGLSSHEFLERYAIIEFCPDDLYPKVYLAMVDDGQATCPFVDASSGCRVYHDRPGACRIYPVGRGASIDADGKIKEQFIILHEDHCCGFTEDQTQTVHDWQNNQQTNEYNRFNDVLLSLLPRNQAQAFQRLSSEEATLFIDTLYNLEQFRSSYCKSATDFTPLAEDESALLFNAINWLKQQWQPTR